MSTITIPTNAICAGLFSRHGDGKFHWTIIIPFDGGNAVLLHAINNKGGAWFYERKTHGNIYQSATLCVIVQIGMTTQTNTIDRIDKLLSNIPMSIPIVDSSAEPAFTCRVWFKEAVRVLNTNGILRCPDVYALEAELVKYGQAQDSYTTTGQGYKAIVAAFSK